MIQDRGSAVGKSAAAGMAIGAMILLSKPVLLARSAVAVAIRPHARESRLVEQFRQPVDPQYGVLQRSGGGLGRTRRRGRRHRGRQTLHRRGPCSLPEEDVNDRAEGMALVWRCIPMAADTRQWRGIHMGLVDGGRSQPALNGPATPASRTRTGQTPIVRVNDQGHTTATAVIVPIKPAKLVFISKGNGVARVGLNTPVGACLMLRRPPVGGPSRTGVPALIAIDGRGCLAGGRIRSRIPSSAADLGRVRCRKAAHSRQQLADYASLNATLERSALKPAPVAGGHQTRAVR